MQLRYNSDKVRFEFSCLIEEKYIPKAAGFWFDGTARVWHTATGRKSPGKNTQKLMAAKLYAYADDPTKKLIGKRRIEAAAQSAALAAEESTFKYAPDQRTHEDAMAWLRKNDWKIVDWNTWRDPYGFVPDCDIFRAVIEQNGRDGIS